MELSFNTEVFKDLTKTSDEDKYEYIFQILICQRFFNQIRWCDGIYQLGYNKLFKTNINEKVLVNNLSYKSLDTISNLGFINTYQIYFRNFNADSKILHR